MSYYPRLIEKKIDSALKSTGVVVVAGPKFCGKTTTAKVFSKSFYSLDTKEKIELCQTDPKGVLVGENPRLIDEWQNVPDLWNVARSRIDESDNKFGQFIFTGSSTPADKDDIYHSGAGRIVTVKMKPFSLLESKESDGSISLKSLFDGQEGVFNTNDSYSINDTAFYVCRGGWPLSVLCDKETSLLVTKNYISTLFEFENNPNKKFRNKKQKLFEIILKSYARNISTEVRRSVMIKDIIEHEDRKIDEDTYDSYLEALNDLYIIKDIEAWNPNFRSKTAVISNPTRHFVDTSIATAILNISPNDLINDPKSFGLFFEDFAVKELSIYADYLNGEVRHYRDSNGLECDSVVHLENGDYALIEIKLGGERLINEGISNLKKLSNKLKEDKKHLPSFMAILTASGPAYTKDGIHIIPINLLGI